VPSRLMHIVLVVQDASLRSALIARLSIAGASLVTARDLNDPALRRGSARPAVLIVDEATIAEQLDAMLGEPRWHRVVVLTASTPSERASDADPRLIHVQRDATAARIAECVPGWRPDAEE